jgi:hypothetical protein
MWEIIHAFVFANRKGFGIAGDSFTFAGALFLAAEALWKRRERMAIGAREAIVELLPERRIEKDNR